MLDLVEASLLLFVMLNPFLLSIYLRDLFEDLDRPAFFGVMLRAATISGLVFAVFAAAGDRIFQDVLSVRFASFQVFGGLVFVVVGLRYVLRGPGALRELRGNPEHLAGSVAMPILIGPGSVSAAVMMGAHAPIALALTGVVATQVAVVLSVFALKWLFDLVRKRDERLVERYMDVVGRVSALVIGTIAVELVLTGLGAWYR